MVSINNKEIRKEKSTNFLSMTCDKFHDHNTRSSLDYHQYIHKVGIHNGRPTTADVNFITNSLYTLKRSKTCYMC
jgi:hypothetical protein